MPYNLYNRAGIVFPPALRGYLQWQRTIITSTTAVDFIPNKYTKMLFIQAVGGGGGGKNCANSTSGNIVLGGGGGGGGYAEMILAPWPTGLSCACGAGGSGTTGTAGGTTNISQKVGSNYSGGALTQNILSASPGAAGTTLANGSTTVFTLPANIAVGNALTSICGFTRLGGTMFRASGTLAVSGKGGNSMWGGGGKAIIAHGNGNPGGNYGGGGSGGMSVNAGGTTVGGDGAQGLIIIWEFQ